MEIIHKLTYNGSTTVIDEPIGFDDLKMTIKRHDFHGMGAEFSLGNLEFYGQAFNIIAAAYAADIDSEVLYEVYADTTLIYSGKIDLSTYSVKQADYQSVSVKVGEIGVKTTFNNRLDTEVDLNVPKTIDGDTVQSPDWLNLHIPMKHLLYTNEQKSNNNLTLSKEFYQSTEKRLVYFSLGNKVNEFGVLENEFIQDVISGAGYWEYQNYSFFHEDENFANTYGNNTTKILQGSIQSEVAFKIWIGETGGLNPLPLSVYVRIVLLDENGGVLASSQTITAGQYTELGTYDIDAFLVNFEFDNISSQSTLFSICYEIAVECNGYGGHLDDFDVNPTITINKASYIKMRMYDTLVEETPVNAEMLLVHDALNIITHCISENALAVKSDWYKTPDSHWENGNAFGGGSLKALTNGYHIRGLFTDANNERNMPMSFKNLINSLNALDCIGWGFSTEDNTTCVRVERWSWFYKNEVILTLNDVAEVQIDIAPDHIVTELKIGYKKYATNDQYNSIDSPHGTRTFVNGIKAVSRSESQECDFIADNYAIEETRRAATQEKETKETTYDENIFIFELVASTNINVNIPSYTIQSTATNTENISRPNEFINAKLTPRHMAARWRSYLFATNNQTPFNFNAGEINYKAVFDSIAPFSTDGTSLVHSLKTFEEQTPQAENDPINYTHAIFKAEKITFSYPLTIAQYQTLKTNPYGLVSVNGMLGWILDFKYSFNDSMADFTLLASENNLNLR